MLMMQSREVMDSRFFLCYGLGKLKCGNVKFCIFLIHLLWLFKNYFHGLLFGADEYSISNAYNVSDIFVNPTNAQAKAFIEMYVL